MKSFDNEQSRSKWSSEVQVDWQWAIKKQVKQRSPSGLTTLSTHSTETHQGNELTLSSHSTETHQGNELTLSSHITETHQGNELTHNSSENIHPLASAHCGLVPGLTEWNWCAPAHLRSQIKWHRWGMISPTTLVHKKNATNQDKTHSA